MAFADPARADDELTLAHQLLDRLDQRSTVLLAHTVALIKDAGTDLDVTGRAEALQTEVTDAGLPWLHRFINLALAFHHAVRGAHHDLAATITQLQDLTIGGDYAFFTDIAHFMGNLPLPETDPRTRWLNSTQATSDRWRALVAAWRAYLTQQS
ncbi:hypothetical protein [Streptomyces sp. NPDC006551]|uniref:hypothetical protein n=1 Tax=Streptomyces sp. NPDC006551 TaxID=3157178 RepID=UPI0033AF46D9